MSSPTELNIENDPWMSIDPKELRFDLQNPRFVEQSFNSEDKIIEYLYHQADVDELIQSILSAGYADYEPMIVLREDHTVLEGNRRLAALRLIADSQLRARLNVTLPRIDNAHPPPNSIRVYLVNSRDEARAFIGFKHINGPFKWDALAKARYAADWLRGGGDIATISRKLGDNHSTVRRLVNGWYVLAQAQENGFDLEQRTRKTFAFSHLYTAITRAPVKDFLGLRDDDPSAPPRENPIAQGYIDELLELMSWLYGQQHKREPTVIQSQNPNLNQLSRVLAKPDALKVLRARRDLQLAFERVEPPSARFEEALLRAATFSEEAVKLAAYYEGNSALLQDAENVERTISNLLLVMRRVVSEREQRQP